ncbi:MAG TPA: beta-galactosidase [Vicinamibacterales bacterium]|nr:beta-galactosidase [Vicinamibacterales bacterium]
MPVTVLILALLASPSEQRVGRPPTIPISVLYGAPMSLDLMVIREDLARIRSAGFDSITTVVSWRDAHPRRGAFHLLVMDRVIAAAAEAGLTVMVKASMDARPAWGPTDDDAAGFLDYLRRRALLHPVVLTVDVMTLNDAKPAELIAVGTEPGAVSPRLARLRLWTAIAHGTQSVGFVGDGHLLTRALLAVGETAGVVTRNQALFGPLRPIDPATGHVTVTGANGRVEVRILESPDALVIVGLNQSDRVQKVTMTFSPGIPEATWQNIEDGVGVNVVAGNVGPWFAHTFAPHDALVLTIRKKLRGSW